MNTFAKVMFASVEKMNADATDPTKWAAEVYKQMVSDLAENGVQASPGTIRWDVALDKLVAEDWSFTVKQSNPLKYAAATDDRIAIRRSHFELLLGEPDAK